MKFRRTDKKEKLNQEADERGFLSFCEDKSIQAKKLPRRKGKSSTDFELAVDGVKVFIELKSRFDDKTYDTFLDSLCDELAAIQKGIDYSIQVDYCHKMKMPKKDKWSGITQAIIEKINAIDDSAPFPIELKFDLNIERILFYNENERLLHEIYPDLIITLENRNNEGIMRLNSVSGSGNVFDAQWICDRIEYAAIQLKDYDLSSPKGVFFINNTPHTWGYTEQLIPFYFPTSSTITGKGNKDLIVLNIKQENILRTDNLTIISFLGFLQRSGGKITELDLFLNPHADRNLPLNIVKRLQCFAHWVTPVNSRRQSVVIRSFRPDLND